jgi:uncharacterized protein
MSAQPDMGAAGGAAPAITVGVISDTHGHLYREVREALSGVDHIIHAGDIGASQVLAELRAIAPVTAVRGNCDYDDWALSLPVRADVELGGTRIVVGHVGWQVQEWAEAANRAAAAGGAGADRLDAVVFGHSHQSHLERREGMLYLNPGSAGPRRFNRPRSVARLVIRPAVGAAGRPGLEAEIVELD